MKTAVVLSGGGSKGSYQLGVWKALKCLHIKYDIVTGTSIGALNGVLMCEKNYFKAKRIWSKVNLEYLFKQQPVSNKEIDILKLYGKNIIKNGGMDIENIETIIKKSINKNKFYKSNIDFGLITYNFTTKKPLILTKNKIKKDKLVDYLMASATCFPAFKMKDIDGFKYIDGGYYDNLPIELALDMGAEALIIVDLEAPGIKRKPSRKVKSITIKPKNNLSFFLDFSKENTKRNIKYGFNDTMKAFKKLDGNKFSFKKDSITKYYLNNKDKLLDYKEKDFLNSLESLGKTFKLDESKIYSLKSYSKALKEKIEQEILDKKMIKSIKDLTSKINTKTLIIYFLKNKRERKLNKVFSKEYKLARYLEILGVEYGK